VQAQDLTRYYADQKDLKDSTKQLHHAVLSSALQSAVDEHKIFRNPAKAIERKRKPRAARTGVDIKSQCWTSDEARKFLAVVTQQPPQPAAFFTLALDAGMRKSELLGLRWSEVNLETGTLQVVRQLVDHGVRRHGVMEASFGPTKTQQARTINLGAEAVRLLREHKRSQATLKMKNRAAYRDLGLVFAREHADTYGHVPLGYPLAANVIADAQFHALSKQANVPRIVFHGLRHSMASLMLQAGEPVKVVSERLGHSQVSITLDTYQHVLPGMQASAADRLNQLLHG
jgi:integrase